MFPVIIVLFISTAIDTAGNGFFFQKRIGQFGKPFTIYKFRTIHTEKKSKSNFGKFLRKYRIDEIPQLFNILKGDMSFIGPRPDIPGYYDRLTGKYQQILVLKPGIASEAAIKYLNEEEMLNLKTDALAYNDDVIFPDKLEINLQYLEKMSFKEDLRIFFLNLFAILRK